MNDDINIYLIVLGVFVIPLALFLLIWGLIDIWKNRTKRKKWITAIITVLIIIIPIIGPLAYLE